MINARGAGSPRRPLDDVDRIDALLLKGDAHPAMRSIMTLLMVLEEPPDPARLADAFESASRTVPRMRHRVSTPAGSLGPAEWVIDNDFELTHHLRRVGAPGDRSVEAVLAFASDGATAPFDPARPLWDAMLFHGITGGRAALLLRAHHAIADGVRALHMLASLLDLEPSPEAQEMPDCPEAGPGPVAASIRRLTQSTIQSLTESPGRALAWNRAVVDLHLRPVGTVTRAWGYVRSVLRSYDRGGAQPSPLLRHRSTQRRFCSLGIPLDGVKRTAKVHGVTVNDVFLASLLGGLRAYHEALGVPVCDLPLAFPIDVAGGVLGSGNHISAAVIPAPASVEDPVDRLHRVHRLVAARRAEPALDAPARLAPILSQLPSRVAVQAMAAHARRVDIHASNIVGPPVPMFMAGSRIEQMHALGPLPGVAVMAVLLSYDGECSIGFTLDPAAITDVDLFLECMRDAFDELADLHAAVPIAAGAD